MFQQTCDFGHVTDSNPPAWIPGILFLPHLFFPRFPRAIAPHNSHEQRWLGAALSYLSPISGVHTLTTGWFALATQSTDLWLFRVSLGPQSLTMHPATSGHG